MLWLLYALRTSGEQLIELVQDLLAAVPEVVKSRQQVLSLPLGLLLTAGPVVFRQVADLVVQIGPPPSSHALRAPAARAALRELAAAGV